MVVTWEKQSLYMLKGARVQNYFQKTTNAFHANNFSNETKFAGNTDDREVGCGFLGILSEFR